MSKLMKFSLSTFSVFYVLILLLFFAFNVLFFIGLFFGGKKPETKTRTVDLMTGQYSTKLYIPVTINDSIYPFMFDTGSAFDLVDSGLTEKIGLTKEGIANVKLSDPVGTVAWNDSVAYVHKTCAIDNLNVTALFFLNGYDGLFFAEKKDMKESMVGVYFMLNFNWLFNFADGTVTVSYAKDTIPVPALPEDKILTLDFRAESNSNTLMDVTMGGVTFKDVVFYTGYEHTYVIEDKSKNIDIVFSKSDFEELIRNNPELNAIGLHIETGKTIYIIDTLQINDCTMQGILALESKDFVETVFSAQFVRRFKMMHFDSVNRKIELYVSPSDSVRHHRRDLQNFRRAILQYRPSDESSKWDIPDADLLDIVNNYLE